MALRLTAQPEAIFLPKFENATPAARDNYSALEAAGETIFVAAVKSSGSLWIASSRDGAIIAMSKNGSNNIYSSAGHYALISRLQSEFGSHWRGKYDELLSWLDSDALSIGCELVTQCLGDHASVPNEDHLVVNAVLDKATLRPCSPLVLLELQRRFRLIIPGMYMFKSATKFLEVYDHFRFDAAATWDDISLEMQSASWRSIDMPYSKLHSQVLEGFVCSVIPRTSSLMQWAEIGEADSVMVEEKGVLAEFDGKFGSVSELFAQCMCSLDALHVQIEKHIEAQGVKCRVYEPMTVDEVFALVREAEEEGEEEGAVMFRMMADALDRLSIPHTYKCFNDGGSYLVCVHILQDWGFARYEKEREAKGGLPPLLRGNTWHLSFRRPKQSLHVSSVERLRDKFSNDAMGLGSPLGEDGSPRPNKQAKRGIEDTWGAQGVRRHLSDGGPIAGSMWKFKFLSYMYRTFLMRNCGTVLAKTGDMGALCATTFAHTHTHTRALKFVIKSFVRSRFRGSKKVLL